MEETTSQKDGSSAVLNIALEKAGERKKKSYYNTGYSNLATHPSTNHAQPSLTLLSGRKMLLSLWYSDSTLNAFFFLNF